MVQRARLAEQANCDEDLLAAVNRIVDFSKQRELDNEERNLVSIAYKQYVGRRRAAGGLSYLYARNGVPMRMKVKGLENPDIRASWVDDYIHKIEQELEDICAEINVIVEEKLLPTTGSWRVKYSSGKWLLT